MSDTKINITINRRIIDSIWNNDKVIIIAILLIIKNLVKGKTTSITLEILMYAFDLIQLDTRIEKEDVLLSPTWDINKELRKIIILAHENELISFKKKTSNSIGFNLTDKGEKLLVKLKEEKLLEELTETIERTVQKINLSQFKKQHLIW
jgi:hypothetical protein